MSDTLAERAARRFSSLYLTLVSVLVGLVLSDLFSTIHDRMTLWPLTLETARAWCQIFGNIIAVLGAWITYSHLGLLRNRLPTIWDTVDVMLVLVTVPLNAATGRHDGAAWFFWAAAYVFLGYLAVRINLGQAAHEPALAHLKRIGRFGGPYTFCFLGAPGYLVLGLASALHWTTPLVELVGAATAPIAAIIVAILFIREWREAVLHPPAQT